MVSFALSPAELMLVEATRLGEVCVLSDLPPDLLSNVSDPSCVIRAEVIRELLLGLLVEGTSPLGVRISGARVTHSLDLRNVSTDTPLSTTGCFWDRPIYANGLSVPSLDFKGSHIHSLTGEYMKVKTSLLLNGGFKATGEMSGGTIRLMGANIGGQLNLGNCSISNPSGVAIYADSMHVGGSLVMEKNFKVEANSHEGALRILGATIDAQLVATDGQIENSSGPALNADGLRVGDIVHFSSISAEGAGSLGSVRFPGAKLGGLHIENIEASNSSGPSLFADHINIDEDLQIMSSRLSGSGSLGTLRLPAGTIKGTFLLQDSIARNDSGPALVCDALAVGLSVTFRAPSGAEMITGAGTGAAARFPEARVGGSVSIAGGTIVNRTGTALDLRRMSISLIAVEEECIPAYLDNSGKHVGGFVCLNGMSYAELQRGHPSLKLWLNWMSEPSPEFGWSAQPFNQLSEYYARQGRSSAAIDILVAREESWRNRRELGDEHGSASAKMLHTFLGFFLDYGYRTRRALKSFVVLAFLAIGLIVTSANWVHSGSELVVTREIKISQSSLELRPVFDEGLFISGSTVQNLQKRERCPAVEQVRLGVDVVMPVLSSAFGAKCQISSDGTTGQLVTVATWVMRALSWACLTLLVASYTGLLKRM